ncbi:hypothetical protein SD70_08130 [Gordoniibacillus kamchatkensis]|uniref:HTH tetR-type domain-containing protein n=1 Tax=Gordoniibacillus kamchatkensis TaxID=1590651 RepID=A0ABR5AJK1_9BACL|nr:TetR/AcrR family transcriptional regulator [Paenibacillus sp. VKM B-2647]KIL41222.1 hypothetical protein SD70_08130 [Paenibacillus sp. VKM B-2647]
MAMHDIRREALALFARCGYEGTSLADIAKAVGIKTPSIYAHFASKDDLYLAVLDWVLDEYDRLLDKATAAAGGAEQPVRERLKSIYEEFASAYALRAENAFYKRAVFFSPAALQPIVRERVLRVEQRLVEKLARLIEEGRRSGEIGEFDNETVLAAFFCQVDGMFLEHDLYDAELYARRLEQVWAVFWHGIAARKD